MGSGWRHIGSSVTFRGRMMWLDGCVRERELSEHPPDAALHHRVALVNASPSAIATWHSAWTADPEKRRAPRYAPAEQVDGAERSVGVGDEPNERTARGRGTTAEQLRRMRLRYFLKTAPARSQNAISTSETAPHKWS